MSKTISARVSALLIALAFFLACLFAFLFSGCAASSAVDTDFRRKVQSDTTSVNATYDPQTGGAGGQLTNTIIFRDPSK